MTRTHVLNLRLQCPSEDFFSGGQWPPKSAQGSRSHSQQCPGCRVAQSRYWGPPLPHLAVLRVHAVLGIKWDPSTAEHIALTPALSPSSTQSTLRKKELIRFVFTNSYTQIQLFASCHKCLLGTYIMPSRVWGASDHQTAFTLQPRSPGTQAKSKTKHILQ